MHVLKMYAVALIELGYAYIQGAMGKLSSKLSKNENNTVISLY